MGGGKRFLIVDANVLIDYAGTDPGILTLASEQIGTVHVPQTVLDEVGQLTAEDCRRLGLTIVDASLDQMLEAGSRRGRLSFTDRICLILAADHGWTCVTNDKALRSACLGAAVPVWWGLELMVELVQRSQLSRKTALEVAEAIHRANPQHITSAILTRFEQRLREIY